MPDFNWEDMRAISTSELVRVCKTLHKRSQLDLNLGPSKEHAIIIIKKRGLPNTPKDTPDRFEVLRLYAKPKKRR